MSATLHKLQNRTNAWGLESTFDYGDSNTRSAPSKADDAGQEAPVQMADLVELLRELRDFRALTPSLTTTMPIEIPRQYQEVHQALAEAIERGSPIALRRPNDIPLHSLLRFSALLCAFICIGSLAMWLTDLPPLINPFAALLGLIASPFFFAMGQAARIKP